MVEFMAREATKFTLNVKVRMSKIRCIVKRWYIIGLEFLVVLFSGFLIINSEHFQEKIAPDQYWNNKVAGLESGVKKDRWKVKSLEISLEKEKLAGSFNIREAINRARSFGEDVETVASLAEKKHYGKLVILQKNIDAQKRILENDETNLRLAQDKLAHLGN